MWTNANVGQHHHGQVMNSTGGSGGGQDFYKPWPMYTPQFTGLQHNMALHSPRMTPNERPFENQIQVQPLQTISPSKNETSNNNAKKSKIRKPKEQTKKKKKPSGKWNFKNDISMLEFFKDHRCLWDSSDETFGNTGDAKKELVKLSKEMNIDAERIRRRFRKMRERFIVEAHKHSDAERNGKEYSVKWRYFTYLLFLLGKKSQDTGIVKAEIVIDDSNSQSISGRTEELTENLIDATSEIGVTDKNTDGNSEMAAVGIQEANNENKTDQVTNSNAELPPTTPSPAVPAPATPVVPAATTPVVPAPTTPVCPSPAQNGADEGQRVTTTLSPAQPMFCTPQNIIHSGCISESFQLDSDLFGKQVAIHLNSLTPYYREISKLRIQEVMAHVALRSQGYPPVISFKQQSAADNLPNAGMDESSSVEEIIFDEGESYEFVEAVNETTVKYGIRLAKDYEETDVSQSIVEEDESADESDDKLTEAIVLKSDNESVISQEQTNDGHIKLDLNRNSFWYPRDEIRNSGIVASKNLQKRLLEENIQTLLKIREEVEKIRDVDNEPFRSQVREARRKTLSLYSTSCPTLNGVEEDVWDKFYLSLLIGRDGRNKNVDGSVVASQGVVNSSCTMRESSPDLAPNHNNGIGVMTGAPQSSVKIYINDATVSSSQENLHAAGGSVAVGGVLPAVVVGRGAAKDDGSDSTGLSDVGSDCCNTVSAASPVGSGSGEDLSENTALDLQNLNSGARGIVCGDGSPWRRRSWLGLDQDDGTGNGTSQKTKIKRNLARTQRSMSLSSLDSDEDAFYDAHESLTQTSASSTSAIVDLVESVPNQRRDKPRSLSGSSTTCSLHSSGGCISKHSHSSTHLQSEDVADGRRMTCDIVISRKTPKCVDDCLLPPRTPLQKSISTPSILAVKDSAQATVPAESGKVHTSSDWLFDSPALLNPYIAHRRGAVQLSNSLRPLTLEGADDDPALIKRKKRGSLFFRKKKGKDKEKENKKSGSGSSNSGVSNSGHQFVSVCCSNSTVCNVCNKSMANKPALRCENCMVNVHENSCRDQISDCIRFRGPLNKMNIRPVSLQSAMPSLQVPRDRPVPLPTNLKPPLISGFTASSSPPGKENRKQNGGTPPKQTPTSSHSPNIPSLSSPSTTRRTYIPSGYSQWRRVATKLGVNKVINEERDIDSVDDSSSKFGSIIDINSASMESLDDGTSEIALIDDEPELRLTEEEPEAWSSTVDKKLLKKLKDKDIKRQETIYEFIITEKHHCQTLKLMQKVFAQGMLRELHMSQDLVDRLFPMLDTLIELHTAFLKRFRERQKQDPLISSISDILQIQFQGKIAQQMTKAYGEFCSHHKECVSLYKDIYKSDRRFQSFIKNCSLRPLCKNKGIPECILLITQRITKYPLLIESLIKTSKDNKVEHQNLILVNGMVKEFLSNVNAQVAEKEREQRLLEIYHKIDAKSATVYKGKKFKKSDLLSYNRKLRHEGCGFLRHARGKEIEVTVVVLSDVIFFLQDNNQKYSFVTQDNKAGVISLQKLLVREKAGQDNRGIYLISSHPNSPEMYEVICHSAKEKQSWMEAIQSAVELCPEEDEGFSGEVEEERKLSEAKSARLRELTESLHEKDRELAVICEEKMRILGEMMEVVDKDDAMEPVHYLPFFEHLGERPDTRDMLLAAVHEASRLASSLYVTGTNLSRSVSSAGEHQSEAYVSPILPKRAETFGGFDNPNKDMFPKLVLTRKKGTPKEIDQWPQAHIGLLNKNELHTSSGSDLDQKDSDALLSVKNKEPRRASGPLPTRETLSPSSPEKPTMRRSTLAAGFLPLQLTCSDNLGSNGSVDESSSSKELLGIPTPPGSLGREQWATTIQLSHYLNTLMCVFSQHLTSVETLKAELAKANEEIAKLQKDGGRESRDKKSLYRPNQQLEELRNLQGQLTRERTEWQKEKEGQERDIEEKRQELLRLQDGLRIDKEDVNQQRDLLYRQLEALQKKGILLSPSLTVVSTSSAGTAETTTTVQSASDIAVDKHSLSPPPTVADTSGLVSPSVHRRSWSCDMQLPNKDSVMRAASESSGGGGSSSATSSPTQTMEAVKPKPELKPRASASNLTALMKKDLFQVLPINLYSATNQQKTSQGLQVKQQLPMKLASLAGSGSPLNGGGGASGLATSSGVTSSTTSSSSVKPASLMSGGSSSGLSANASGLAQVLNTFPQFKSNGNGSGTSRSSPYQTATTTNPSTVSGNSSSSSISSSSSSSHPQSYLHGHAAQWSGPLPPQPPVDQTAMISKPPPPPPPDQKNKERYRKVRDPDTNQEIIYF